MASYEQAIIDLQVIGAEKSAADARKVEHALQDVQDAESKLDKAQQDRANTQRRLNKEMNESADVNENYNKKIASQSAAVENAKNKVEQLNKQLKRENKIIKDNTASQTRINNATERYNKALKSRDFYQNQVTKGGKRLKSLNKELVEYNKEQSKSIKELERDLVHYTKLEETLHQKVRVTRRKSYDEHAKQTSGFLDRTRRMQVAVRKAADAELAHIARLRIARKKAYSELGKSLSSINPLRERTQRLLGLVFIVGGLVGDALGFAATGLNALGAGALAAFNGLTPVLGVLGAMPAAFVALIPLVAALSMGLKGIGKAYSDDDALSKLGPETQKFVLALREVGPQYKELQQLTQDSLFGGMGEDIKALTAIYMPNLQIMMQRIGHGIRDNLVGTITEFMRTKPGVETMNAVFDQSAQIIELGSKAAGNLAVGLLRVAEAAGPVAVQMFDDLNARMEEFNRYTEDNGGGIAAWAEQGYERFKAILNVIGIYGSALGNILDLSESLTKYMGKSITQGGKDLLAWTESEDGIKAIRKYFKDMEKPLGAVVRLAGNVAKSIFEIGQQPGFVDLVNKINDVLLPAIVTIVNHSADEFLPAFIDMLSAIAKAADDGLIESAGEALRLVAKGVESLADAFGKLPGWLKQGIVFFFLFGGVGTKFVSGVGKTMVAMKNVVLAESRNIAAGISKIFGKGKGVSAAANAAGTAASAAVPVAPTVGKAGGAAAKVGSAARVGGTVAVGAAGAGGSGIASAGAAAASAAGPIALVVGLIIAIGAAFIAANTDSATFSAGMSRLWSGLQSIWNQLKPTINSAITSVKGGLDSLLAAFNVTSDGGKASWLDIANSIINAIQAMLPIIELLILSIGTQLRFQFQILAVAVAFITVAFKTFWNILKVVWAAIKGGIQIIGALMGVFGRLLLKITPVRQAFEGLKLKYDNFKKSLASGASTTPLTKIKDIVDKIVVALKSASALINGIGDKLTGGIGDLITKAVAGLGTIGVDMNFAGGTLTNRPSMVNELGPELAVSRTGNINWINNGLPGIINGTAGTAIIPASASANPLGGNYGNAPTWAKDRLQEAVQGRLAQSQVSGDSPTRLVNAGVPQSKNSSNNNNDQDSIPTVQIHIGTVSNDVDLENSVARAIRRIQREQKERS